MARWCWRSALIISFTDEPTLTLCSLVAAGDTPLARPVTIMQKRAENQGRVYCE